MRAGFRVVWRMSCYDPGMPPGFLFPEEHRFVFNAVRGLPLTEVPAGFDWDAAVSFAVSHAVLAPVEASLRGKAWVPAAVAERIRALHRRDSVRNTLLAHELLRLTGLFGQAGIATLAYKGAALAMLIHGDLSQRHCSDLDIIVHRGDIERAKRVLLESGYHTTLSPREESFHLRRRYHLHFCANDSNLRVELHWAFTPQYWPFPLSESRLWNQSVSVPLLSSSVRTLDPESTLLALCAHGCKEGWHRLGQIRDLACLIATHPNLDWDWIRGEARRIGREPVLQLGLELARSLLDAPVPAYDSTAARVVQRAFYESRPLNGLRFHAYACRVWPRGSDIAGYLRYVAGRLPSRVAALAAPSAADQQSIHLPARLRFLYYLVRPIRVLRGHTGLPLVFRRILDQL